MQKAEIKAQMVNDKDFYRLIRYLAVLTYEHYQTQKLLADKFGKPMPVVITQTQILENICKDFGLPFKAVLECSKLENWG